jgi:hypothetical protein
MVSNEKKSESRKQSKAVIISALAAGGIFQLNGWQVQAHGNRSSHVDTGLQNAVFSPQDYLVMRQRATAPSARETAQLALVTEQIRNARGTTATASNEYQTLLGVKANLGSEMRSRLIVHQSLNFAREGDFDAAIATIEGNGSPELVLTEYLWVLLDIAYLGDGDALTGDQMKEFVAVSKSAISFSNEVLETLPAEGMTPSQVAAKERIAEIFHNIASFTLPDDGMVSDEDMQMGREAAERALGLRQELRQQAETMRANWMVGKHHVRAGMIESARQYLTTSIEQATVLGDDAGIAWGKAYLAKTYSDATAAALENEARQIVEKVKDDPTIDFLRLELDMAPLASSSEVTA